MVRRIPAEILLGLRLSFAGGRRAWVRTAMAAAGVAIGFAVLLLAASVPVMIQAREAREAARTDFAPGAPEVPAGDTLIVAGAEGQWGGDAIRGRLIWPESPAAPLPPGVRAFPADRQMYVSPALHAALAGPDGDVLRRQMPYEVVGTIEPAGLSGPAELTYYAGYREVGQLLGNGAQRVDTFGRPAADQPDDAGTYVTVAALVATLLLPIAIFIGAAFRFGTDTRDRRLAAIRLVGADRRAVLRIAVGESLAPAVLGSVAGLTLYLLARMWAADLPLFGFSAFPGDIRPVPALAASAVLLVVGLAAAMTLAGFRGATVEPLGVFRSSTTWQGRLWWRLIPLAASLALLYPLAGDAGAAGEEQTGLGVVLLVVALVPLLPYLVPLVSRLLPGGPASWQLASQQLRRNPAASTRAVTGIAVAVTGAIALHTFLAAATVNRARPDAPADPAYMLQADGALDPAAMRTRSAMFETVAGVHAGTIARRPVTSKDTEWGIGYLVVGDCAALSRLATLDRCADGDVFVFGDVGRSVTLQEGDIDPVPGRRIPIPRSARPAVLVGSDAQNVSRSVLMTSAAAPAVLTGTGRWLIETRVFTGPDAPVAVSRQIRGVAAEIDPIAHFTAFAPEYDKFAGLRTALNVGSTVILLMMGLGLLLDVAARLHERRRLLGVLTAVGARRSTVVWSVLLQAIVPLLAGLALATGIGIGLGAALMRMSQVPIRFDVPAVLTPVALGFTLVLATTVAVLLPAARRITSTEDLRYE
ncbi:membrane protein [Actinoplanes philippinensis]|uniref:FtsX-like permease family protein n=1 Tax=Actinoplanes philippinensis TaxID=35752 RepID=A0A1I2IA40_9ACTN|nr:ABC transporter permease [Actinoplanes philippinensis]GIE78447.1 membrane protein [Actinoplanes philippinensis]SFF39094.1 FtsX-like permease family protein [Actinoplanes philippinensis]